MVNDYHVWCDEWKDFLAERTYRNGSWSYTHYKTVRVRNSINKLIRNDILFSFTDPVWDKVMPCMTNRIEGGVNAPLRQMLLRSRGLSLSRRIKAIF